MRPEDSIPDARDGLTRLQRVVLWKLRELQEERGGRSVPVEMLWGSVVEHVDISKDELQDVLRDLDIH